MSLPVQVAAVALLAAASSEAAYQYIHYPTRNAPFTPIYEKFNLDALPNKTVTFFAADQAPNVYPSNEFGSMLSQIRQAAAAWNSVAISDLRVAFGGLQSYTENPTVAHPGSPLPGSATPGGDILFVDTPGVLGLSATTISTVPVQGPAGQFFPIVRSVMMISRDTGAQPWPSSAETFFTTAVHEMGHALGLQHTWTGSAMTQGRIRMTSRARPLEADDIAGLATLYGKAGWQSSYGSISGRVTFANNGSGVSLASVVAISPIGPAVSALTNPDGTYRIEGLPAGYSYNVYAHPLPPDAVPADESGLRRPVDSGNTPFAPSGAFQTVFYSGGSGTLDPQNAAAFAIAPATASGPATTVANINFSVQPRSETPTYNVQTWSRITAATREYGYPGDATVEGYPGFINASSTRAVPVVIVRAQDPAILPVPQSVTIMGGFAPATTANYRQNVLPAISPYSNAPGDFIAIYFVVPPNAGSGPRHMVFNFGNDIYVLPSGINLVHKGPPVATAAAQNGDGTVTVTGAGFGPDSRVYFDGAQASAATFSGTETQGSLTVTPPPGANGQVARVTVYNSDAQNSTIIPTAPVPTFTYPAAGPQVVSVFPNSVPAGTAAMVEVTVAGMSLTDGQLTVGFGSDDVQVRRVWVAGATRALVNIYVAPNATAGMSQVSVLSGMQLAASANSFQIQPARPGAPAIASVANADPGQQAVLPGSFATLFGSNLTGAQVSLNDVPAQVVFSNAGQVNFIVPAGLPAGPATLRLSGSSGAALAVLLQIDAPPPTIMSVNTNGAPAAGDTVQVLVTGLDAAAAGGPNTRVRVAISGLEMPIQQVQQLGPGVYLLHVTISQSFGSSSVPVVVSADSTSSAPFAVTVR